MTNKWKIFIAALVFIAGFLILAGINEYGKTCCAPPKKIDKTKLAPIPETKAECIEKGGEWKKIGLSESEKCNLKTTDAGQKCTDSSECEGSCLGKSTSSTTGTCSSLRITAGCHYFVNKGKVQGQLCAD